MFPSEDQNQPKWIFHFYPQAENEKEKVLKGEILQYYQEWEKIVQKFSIQRCFDTKDFSPIKGCAPLVEAKFKWKGNQIRFFWEN
jgi:hypothetical protein